MKGWIFCVLTGVMSGAGCIAPALNCTMMGCQGELLVAVDGSTLEDGEYTVDLVIDGISDNCAFDVPFNSETASCTGSLTIEPSGNTIEIRSFLMMGQTFESVDVVVSENDRVAYDENAVITWDEPFYPNGEACDRGFGCYAGAVEVAL